MAQKQIFFSLSEKDKDKVSEFYTRMKIVDPNIYKCWIYYEDLPNQAGQRFDAKIVEAIQKSDFVLCFISRNYLKSNNCKTEYILAHRFDKNIIPIMLEDGVKLEDDNELAFQAVNVQYLKLSDSNNNTTTTNNNSTNNSNNNNNNNNIISNDIDELIKTIRSNMDCIVKSQKSLKQLVKTNVKYFFFLLIGVIVVFGLNQNIHEFLIMKTVGYEKRMEIQKMEATLKINELNEKLIQLEENLNLCSRERELMKSNESEFATKTMKMINDLNEKLIHLQDGLNICARERDTLRKSESELSAKTINLLNEQTEKNKKLEESLSMCLHERDLQTMNDAKSTSGFIVYLIMHALTPLLFFGFCFIMDLIDKLDNKPILVILGICLFVITILLDYHVPDWLFRYFNIPELSFVNIFILNIISIATMIAAVVSAEQLLDKREGMINIIGYAIISILFAIMFKSIVYINYSVMKEVILSFKFLSMLAIFSLCLGVIVLINKVKNLQSGDKQSALTDGKKKC